MDSKLVNEERIEEIENEVNTFIEEKILKQGRTDYLDKWNYYSLLELSNEESKQKFLEVVDYIEELELEEEEKISQILTLSYLIVKEKLVISDMDANNLYLLVSYLDKLELGDISANLNKANDKELLLAIRMETLDTEIRVRILEYMSKENKEKQEILKMLEEMEYYDLVKAVG